MRALLALIPLVFLGSPARAAEPAVSDIEVIPLHDGVNTVPRFAADGRAATIVQAWRDNGNAHGYFLYLTLLPVRDGAGPDGGAGLVPFDEGADAGGGGLKDAATVSPFDGERVLGALRFARARVDGAPATIAIRADLGETSSGVLADHAPATIRIYRLEHPGVGIGTTPDVFRLISKATPEGRFCNADMALAMVLRLPLPSHYAGGKGPSGCGPAGS